MQTVVICNFSRINKLGSTVLLIYVTMLSYSRKGCYQDDVLDGLALHFVPWLLRSWVTEGRGIRGHT